MTALVLSGGGARASYQVGVVRGVQEICKFKRNPFKIICGTSAGAINAAFLAGYANDMTAGIHRLQNVWSRLDPSDVYKTSWFSVLWNTLRLGQSAAVSTKEAVALLDNCPLRLLLTEWLDFDAINRNLDNGMLNNLAITAMDYSSGESVSFYHGKKVTPWKRAHRKGKYTEITLDHIMASTAIPILFPPQRLNGNYFGDGALRQLHPLSSSVRLGATRLFVVGVSANEIKEEESHEMEPPTIAQMAGHLLNREFIDNLEADIELATKLNMLIEDYNCENTVRTTLEKIEIEVIAPSVQIDEVALKYIHQQPRSVRLFFRMLGARGHGAGASFASYLMFNGDFCRELMDTGYRDAWDNAEKIKSFFCK